MTTEAFSSKVGATAQAMHLAWEKRSPAGIVIDSITCPKCGSKVHIKVMPNGTSSGHCTAAACLRWSSL